MMESNLGRHIYLQHILIRFLCKGLLKLWLEVNDGRYVIYMSVSFFQIFYSLMVISLYIKRGVKYIFTLIRVCTSRDSIPLDPRSPVKMTLVCMMYNKRLYNMKAKWFSKTSSSSNQNRDLQLK